MPERDEAVVPTDGASGLGESTPDGAVTVDSGEGSSDVDAPTSAPLVADETLVAARGLARSALLEVTPQHTIGRDAGHLVEAEHVLSHRFSSRVDGYVGWFWVVTIARVEDADPTVLEISMMPGDGALTAPDWVPWSDRLADYRASQEAAEAAAADTEDLEDDDDIDESDLDESDLDEDDEDLDIDDAAVGVDEDSDDEDSDDEDSDDDDDSDEDDDDEDSDDGDDEDESDDDDSDDDDDESDDDEDDEDSDVELER